MIKDRLMNALKKAASDYNAGSDANSAVAAAAKADDFNEKQAERLVEMFNTLAALNKEKDKDDPTGSCELADKKEVAKMLLGDSGSEKKAYAPDPDYSFYLASPEKTNGAIEARVAGRNSMMKAASFELKDEDPVLNLSQGSLYKVIKGKIELLKSAADAADEVVRNLRLEVDREAVKIAKAIESPSASIEVADLFKAACHSKKAVAMISEYSTRLADSDGGEFARMHVFDSSPVEDMLKSAEEMEKNISAIPEYEKRRDMYMSKASGFEEDMLSAVGLGRMEKEGGSSLSDMLSPSSSWFGHANDEITAESAGEEAIDAGSCIKIAELIRKAEIPADQVESAVCDLEKGAAPKFLVNLPIPSFEDTHTELTRTKGLDSEKKTLLNVRRAVILADLMSNDPIIRDADPNTVTEAYRTMVMSSPRVSLDKSQVRAFLRGAINSIAISPSDAKVITDVDKGVRNANVDTLSFIDSSIKDSNE